MGDITKSVEQVKTGDTVMSRDEQSGKTEPEKVTATIKHYNVPTVTLTFSNGDQVVTTGVHPVYVQGKGFVPASDLAIGNAIVTRAGPAATITKIEQTAPETVYNITVDGDHTYFVGSEDGGVWVHNTNPLECPSSSLIDPDRLDHILNGEFNKAGELTGGGHRFGTSFGKVVNKPGGAPHTEFPASWSDEDIADSIVNVATDPTSVAGAQVGKVGVPLTKAGNPARWSLSNTVNGVNVKVIWEPAGRGIVTAFPF